MRRAIVGNLVGVRPVVLLVLALVVLLGAGPALAQDPVFKTFTIDYYRSGDSVRTLYDAGQDGLLNTADDPILYASGILCASDADKDIFRKNNYKDDKWSEIKRDGWLNTRRGYVRLLKKTMDRPIIANIERNDQVYLATIIENVTPSIVTALRTGSAEVANAAMAGIISMVTADFSAGLFADHTNRSVYSDLHPTFATSTVAIREVLNKGVLPCEAAADRVEADKTGDLGSETAASKINVTNSVVVYWDISGLTVSATDSIQAKQNFSATMAINGGGKTDAEKRRRTGTSNFIGIETGLNSAPIFLSDWAKWTECAWTLGASNYTSLLQQLGNNKGIGLFPGINLGIQISQAWDNTTSALYNGGAVVPETLEPRRWLVEDFKVNNENTKLPFQFRTKDDLAVQVEVISRADLDGEPDMYFGANSDALSFDNDGKGTDKFLGAEYKISGWKVSDQSNVFSSARTFRAISPAGDGADLQGGALIQTPQQVIDYSMTIADSVITSGTYEVFKVKAMITDEVQAATFVFTEHAIDTAAPLYTAALAYAERDDKKERGSDIGTTKVGNYKYDEALFYLEIEPNGESIQAVNVRKWLSMQFRDTGRTLDYLKNGSSASAANQLERRFSDYSQATGGTQVGSLAFVDYKDATTPVPEVEEPELDPLGGTAAASNYYNTIKATATSTLITTFPSTGYPIMGASVTIRVRNNVSTTINSGGLLVRAMDDARNPVIVYEKGASGPDLANPLATLDTTKTTYSVYNTNPVLYNTIKSATVEIDNQPPLIDTAQLSVVGLPSSYWASNTSTADVFKLLKGAEESVDNAIFTSPLKDADDPKAVIRGAAGDGLGKGGSPLRLYLKFKPVKDLSLVGEDTDGRPWTAKSAAENVAEFNKRFKFNITSADLGYNSDGFGVNYKLGNIDKKAWVVQDATIVVSTGTSLDGKVGVWDGNYASSEVHAILVESSGIPKGTGNGSGLYPAPLTLQAGDAVVNFDSNSASSGIILDERKPTVATYNMDAGVTVVDSKTKPTNTGTVAVPVWTWPAATHYLYMTTYLASQKIPSSEWAKPITDFDITIAGTNDRFYNSPDIAGATWPGVKAGDSIIVAGMFKETVAGGDDAFVKIGNGAAGYNNSGFPFIMGEITTADPGVVAVADWTFDTAGTLFGTQFKTISADFGSFINQDSEKDVLPDRIEVYDGAGSPGAITTDQDAIPAGRTIVAKWFYYLDGGKSLNLGLAGGVRNVTLTARDLSGNVNNMIIEAGTASFSQPQVTILDYEIDNPMLGRRRSVIQRHSSYLGGAGANAVSLSQATVTVRKDADDKIKSSTVMVVAKIGDGVAKGGPYQAGTDFLKADFTMLGGTLEAPDKITYADGTSVTNGAAVSKSQIIYATWWSERFNANAGLDSGGKADKNIKIQATAATLGVGEAEGTAVQLDSTIPAVTVTNIVERRALDNKETAPGGDSSNDGIIRPNQAVSYSAFYEMDPFDKNYSNLIKFAADLSAFNNPIPTPYLWSGHKDLDSSGPGFGTVDPDEKTVANTVIRGVTFQFTVPGSIKPGLAAAISYVTDAAGNFDSAGKKTADVTVNTSRPTISAIVLSATSDVNYATDIIGAMSTKTGAANPEWRAVGTRTAGDPNSIISKEQNLAGSRGSKEGNSIVNAGDWIKVVAQIRINDTFTDLDVKADFSDFSGDAYKSVVPAPYTGIKSVHKYSDANHPPEVANGLVEQGTTVSGGVYTATWIHIVQPADKNISNASVRIMAKNPTGVSVVDDLMVYSAPMVVDNKAPEVTSQITYYKKGKPLASDVTEINPNTTLWVAGKANVDVGYATAVIVVSATYTDADTMHGNAASLFNALVFTKGWNPASYTDADKSWDRGVENGYDPKTDATGDVKDFDEIDLAKIFSLDKAGAVQTDAKPAFFALSDKSGVWSEAGSSTDGPVIVSASRVNGADADKDSLWGTSAIMLRDSTATVLNIWYGQHPNNNVTDHGQYKFDSPYSVTFKANSHYGAKDRKLATSVKDSVGNSSKPSLTGVEIDGMMPFIQIGRVPRNKKNEAINYLDANRENTTYQVVEYADDPAKFAVDDSNTPQDETKLQPYRHSWYGKKTIKGATLDVAPGQPLFNTSGEAVYIPAQWAANGNMLRPTRVTKGTKVRLHTFLMDYPDTTDPITLSLDGRTFNAKASSFEIVKPVLDDRTDVDYSAGSLRRDKNNDPAAEGQLQTDYIWTTTLDPTKATENAVEVIVDIPVNWDKGKPEHSTIRLDQLDPGNLLNAPKYDQYRNAVKNNVLDIEDDALNLGGGPKTLASPIMGATDTVGNWRKAMTASVGVEIDTQGPAIVSYYASFARDKAAADKISLADIKNNGINANAGAWLVLGATYVVDGTNDLDFSLDNFNVNWTETFEFDTDRLEHDKNYKGKKTIYSATSAPSIVYATNIIKIRDNSTPRNASSIKFTAKDIFGNVTEITSDQQLAIGARGPSASEVSLKVAGKSQTDPNVSVSKLGIGNKGPDAKDASFEMYPGANIIVEATVTTIDGVAPDTILLDASDLYPVGLRPMVDELIPTEQRLTNDGNIYCRWETIAYDLEGIKVRAAAYIDPIDNVTNKDQWKAFRMPLFFDQSNLNWIIDGVEYTSREKSLGTPGVAGTAYNAPIEGATPVVELNQNSITMDGAKVNNVDPTKNEAALFGGPKATHMSGTAVANMKTALKSIKGLPNLQLQQNAAAKRVAAVTVFVADGNSKFPFEETMSTLFTVDTEPPRASYVFSVTNALNINERYLSGWRIGQPTAPNAARNNLKKPAPRVRVNDSVEIVVNVTNSLINGSGNDAFRDLPGLLPSDLTTGFFTINAANSDSIKDVTVDLSGFSSLAGAKDMSVRDPNAPVANPAYPNIVTIIDRGSNKPSVIEAKFSVKVTGDRGTNVLASNDPVEVTPTVVDDSGNRPLDTVYDKSIVMDNLDYVPEGNKKDWPSLQALAGRQAILAVDNRGPSINGSVAAQIISGTASIYNDFTKETEILLAGSMLENNAVIAAGTVLRVTVTVADQVDNPLDLIIEKNNFGKMKLTAEGLKLAQSSLDSGKAKLAGSDSISVPFEITVPPKETGKSTFSFQFIIQATDTVGNMTEIRSLEKFGFDANPDVEYFDVNGAQIVSGKVMVNAGPVATLVSKAKALDVGGVRSVEWIADAVEGVTLIVKDIDGNLLENNKLEDLTNAQRVDLDLFALIPIGSGGVTPFNAHAVVTDIDNNTNELSVIQVSINQPPIIAASLPFSSTNDLFINETGDILETIGAGYNAAFADIREVTIEEGTVVSLNIAATDANTADTVTVSATGTAITSPNIVEGVVTPGAGMIGFSFKPGYLAVTGSAESATFALDVKASDGTTMAPDTMSLVFNVLAKSATPIIAITSQKVDGISTTDTFPKINEGSTIEIVFSAQDPGNEALDVELLPVPAAPALTDTSITAEGIVYGTFTFTAGLQDADVKLLGYDSPIDPLYASFKVSNASFSNEILVPIDILNVSQAPVISATATVNDDQVKKVENGDKIAVKAGDNVNIEFLSVDPDGDPVLTGLEPTVTPDIYAMQYSPLGIGTSTFRSLLTVTIPANVTPENGTATIVYTTSDNTPKERTITLYLVVDTGTQPPEPAEIDNILVSQGWGGKNTINYKNIDKNVTEIDGRTVAQTSTYRAIAVAAGPFLAGVGGGVDREARMALGDLDGDGDLDVALSMGVITAPATDANIVVVKDAKTRKLIGNSFVAFHTGTDAINYNNGDIPIAVGNFIGSTTADQIACAQGFGGSNIIRIYQYTGREKPNGFAVVAQFNGLSALALTNNANGGVTLAAGDLNGNGRDELIIGQTNSDTSRTQFAVIGVNNDGSGSVVSRAAGVAFAGKRQFQGNGGINPAVVDLDGDGKNEIVFASAGNTQDFTVDVGRNNSALNVISIVKPVVADGVITGFTLANSGIVAIFSKDTSSTGAMSIAGVEGDGLANGTELILGTKPVLSIDSDTLTITPLVKAARAKYTFVKVGYDGTTNTMTGLSQFLGQMANGFNAFPLDLDPAGAGVNVAAGQTD